MLSLKNYIQKRVLENRVKNKSNNNKFVGFKKSKKVAIIIDEKAFDHSSMKKILDQLLRLNKSVVVFIYGDYIESKLNCQTLCINQDQLSITGEIKDKNIVGAFSVQFDIVFDLRKEIDLYGKFFVGKLLSPFFVTNRINIGDCDFSINTNSDVQEFAGCFIDYCLKFL